MLWNRKSQKVEQRFAWTNKYNSARSISLLSDSERFASAHSNGPVRIWSLKTVQELKRWTPYVGKAISSTEVFSLHNDRWRLTTQSEYDEYHPLHVWRLPVP